MILRPGETRTMAVDLIAAGELSIRLVDPEAHPVPGAHVRFVGPIPDGTDFSTINVGQLIGVTERLGETDEQGVCRVPGVPAQQSHAFHAWTESGALITGVATSRPAPSEPTAFTLAWPVTLLVEVVDAVTGEVVPGALLSPVDNAEVELRGQTRPAHIGELGETLTTDSVGQARLTCQRGAWLLTGAEGYTLSCVSVSDAAVAAGRLQIQLDSATNQRVRVLLADGTPVRGATVRSEWQGLASAAASEDDMPSLTSDEQGCLDLADLGSLDELAGGTLILTASHRSHGKGATAVSVGQLLRGEATFPRTIVLRRPGSLRLGIAASGWPTPDPTGSLRATNPGDYTESRERELILSLTLRFLGSPAARLEVASQHGEVQRVELSGLAGDGPSVVFDDLEPGIYTVIVASRQRGLRFPTPSLHVLPGQATHYWLQPPDRALYATVTLDLGMTPLLASDGSSSPEVILDTAEPQPGHAALPIILPVTAGDLEVRRTRMPASGRITFDWVAPGEYTIALPLQDLDRPGHMAWRETEVFRVGPGDDVVVRSLR